MDEVGPFMEKILMSVVTYNSKDIFETLENFKKEILPYFPVTLQIFDNHSEDEYLKKLKDVLIPGINLTAFQENKGFGYGHNYNFTKRTDEEIFVVCNPDILVKKDDFATLVDALSKTTEKFGMVTPKILYKDGTTQHVVRKRLDVFDYILRFQPFSFIKKIFKKRMAAFECQNLTDERQTINFGSGAFMVIKSATYEALNGFDESFFMYFEDNDFCQRLRLQGQKILYVPDGTVIHFYGKEAHRSYRVFKLFMQSMWTYHRKWKLPLF